MQQDPKPYSIKSHSTRLDSWNTSLLSKIHPEADKSLKGLSPSKLARPAKSSKLDTHSLGQNSPARG